MTLRLRYLTLCQLLGWLPGWLSLLAREPAAKREHAAKTPKSPCSA